jgi:hypothetical protein
MYASESRGSCVFAVQWCCRQIQGNLKASRAVRRLWTSTASIQCKYLPWHYQEVNARPNDFDPRFGKRLRACPVHFTPLAIECCADKLNPGQKQPFICILSLPKQIHTLREYPKASSKFIARELVAGVTHLDQRRFIGLLLVLLSPCKIMFHVSCLDRPLDDAKCSKILVVAEV